MASRTAEYMAARSAAEWRERVAAALALRTGLPARPYAPRKVSEALDNPGMGDVTGLPGIAVLARSARTLRFSEDLDRADAIAADREDPDALGVLVQRRQGREIGEAYAVMTLDTLGELLRRADA